MFMILHHNISFFITDDEARLEASGHTPQSFPGPNRSLKHHSLFVAAGGRRLGLAAPSPTSEGRKYKAAACVCLRADPAGCRDTASGAGAFSALPTRQQWQSHQSNVPWGAGRQSAKSTIPGT